MPARSYFSGESFRFLRDLAGNNERPWFQEHRGRYEAHVREPMRELISDLAEPLAQVSAHFIADPRTQGGSLFRIHRDQRFSNDKRPYKTWAGARLFHRRAREVHAPSFYLHLAPDECFFAAGIWHPEPATLRRLREFLMDNPVAWGAALDAPTFRRQLRMGGSSLSRAPRGIPADHPLIEHLKRKDLVCVADLSSELVMSPQLLPTLVALMGTMAPFMDYLCAALDLPFD